MVALSRKAGEVPSPFDVEAQRRFDEEFEKAVKKKLIELGVGATRLWRLSCSLWLSCCDA